MDSFHVISQVYWIMFSMTKKTDALNLIYRSKENSALLR